MLRFLPLPTALLLVACAGDPTGPNAVLVTVSGLPDAALQTTGPLGETLSDFTVRPLARGDAGLPEVIATALCGEPVAPLLGEPRDVVVPAELDTLPEALVRHGIETAAFLTDERLVEELGFLQGVLHAHDFPLLVAESEDGPLRGAVSGTHRFLVEKLPRPMEDAAFAWLHLDLALIPDPDARAGFLAATLDALRSDLEPDPDAATVVAFVGSAPGQADMVAVRSPRVDPGDAGLPLQPFELRDAFLGAMGHRFEAGTSVRLDAEGTRP